MDKIEQERVRQTLLQIFTEREIHVLQLKMYNSVCCQSSNYYGENNVILEKLGGVPVLSTECDDGE